jgi:hypothetical protein
MIILFKKHSLIGSSAFQFILWHELCSFPKEVQNGIGFGQVFAQLPLVVAQKLDQRYFTGGIHGTKFRSQRELLWRLAILDVVVF